MPDQFETRLRALADSTDDADWLDVRRRASERYARPRHRGRRTVRLLAACAAAAAVITAATQLLPRGDNAPRVPGLEPVAAIAAAAPSTVPGTQEYAYTKLSYGVQGAEPDCTEQWWIAPDGSGRLKQEGERCSVPVPDRRFGPGGALRTYVNIHGNALHGDPAALPTDPEELERALDATLRGLSDVTPEELADPAVRSDGMLDVIEQILSNPFAPPAVRAALYRVAGELPEVQVMQGVTDPQGRTGDALTVTRDRFGERERRELIFDPATSRTLASRAISMRSGQVHAFSYLDQGTVSSVDARP